MTNKNSHHHQNSKDVLGKKLQSYKTVVAELLPLALPYSVRKQFTETLTKQKDGALTKSYNQENEDWSIFLSYTLSPTLAKQKRIKLYPILGKDALPVFLAMYNLTKVQKSSGVIFTPKDIADQIYKHQPPDLWKQKTKGIILCMGLATFTIVDKRYGSIRIERFGKAVFAGKKAITVDGKTLKPGEIYFDFEKTWLTPKIPYFKTRTEDLKAIEALPRYMQNGYLWLARNQNTVSHKMNPPYINKFLGTGFELTKKEIADWKSKGKLRPNFDAFITAMKEMNVLEDALLAEDPSKDFSLNRVRFILTKEFENLRATELPPTSACNKEIIEVLEVMIREKISAKRVIKSFVQPKDSALRMQIRSGDFDTLVKRGYYGAQKKKLHQKEM